MHQQIYEFNYDYERRNGHYLFVSHPNGMGDEQLSAHEIRMMEYNAIPGLLPFEYERMDDGQTVRLKYEITHKKMLIHSLASRKISLKQYYQLIYRMVASLVESSAYLLSHERFILDDRFIFTNYQSLEPLLVYLPLKSVAQKPSMQDELRKLTTKWFTFVDELHGHGLQDMMELLLEEEIDLSLLKKNMIKMVDTTSNATVSHAMIPPSEVKAVKNKDRTQIKTWFTSKFRMLNTNTNRNKNSATSKVGIVNPNRHKPSATIPSHHLNHQADLVNQPTALLHSASTTITADSTANTTAPANALKKKYGLRMARPGSEQPTNVMLNVERFLIGRDPGSVDYVDSWPGVSRLHCEIVQELDQYTVKDLGSVNGSYLNGELMIPFKTYPYCEGDVLRIVRTEYVLFLDDFDLRHMP